MAVPSPVLHRVLSTRDGAPGGAGVLAGLRAGLGQILSRRWPGSAPVPLPSGPVAHVLLASEGRAFPADAVRAACERLAVGGTVHVLSVARVWGTSLGFPNPGLMPTRQELAQRHAQVAAAIAAIESGGGRAEGRVVGTRDAVRAILREARRVGAGIIVMGADAEPRGLTAFLYWENEPWRVRARSAVPVQLVVG